MSLQVKEGDKVTIVIYPPKPPGPPRMSWPEIHNRLFENEAADLSLSRSQSPARHCPVDQK